MSVQMWTENGQRQAQQTPQAGKQQANLPLKIAWKPGIIPHLPVPVEHQAAGQLTQRDERSAFQAECKHRTALLHHFAEKHQHSAAAECHTEVGSPTPEGLQGAISHTACQKNQEIFHLPTYFLKRILNFFKNTAEIGRFMICYC